MQIFKFCKVVRNSLVYITSVVIKLSHTYFMKLCLLSIYSWSYQYFSKCMFTRVFTKAIFFSQFFKRKTLLRTFQFQSRHVKKKQVISFIITTKKGEKLKIYDFLDPSEIFTQRKIYLPKFWRQVSPESQHEIVDSGTETTGTLKQQRH